MAKRHVIPSHTQALLPTAGTAGALAFVTDDNSIRADNGTSWVPLLFTSSTYAGPYSIGGATAGDYQFIIRGSFTGAVATIGLGYISTLTVNASQAGVGIEVNPTLVEASSGTHAYLAGMNVVPGFTAGDAATTTASGIRVATFVAPSGTTNAAGIVCEGPPSGASNNYAIWTKSGKTFLEGPLETGPQPSALGTAVSAAALLKIGGAIAGGSQSHGLLTAYTLQPDANTSGMGVRMTTQVTKAGSGTHPLIASLSVEGPGVESGSAGITEAATVYILNAPTIGTNNWALHVEAGATKLDGAVTVTADTATPAGGSTTARLVFGTTAGFGVYYGSGAPTVSAAQGSIYLRSDGSSTTTRLYVNTDGGTTWTNFTSAA